MKQSFSLLITAAALFFVSASVAYEPGGCLVEDLSRYTGCGTSDGYKVRITNQCPDRVYVKVCLQITTTSYGWDCGSSPILQGKRNQFDTCHGTGIYRMCSSLDNWGCAGFEP